ncbi:MAG: hypothetical protein QG594_1593 [Bacteroidota bacterium]|nr:hypothetical protein [Bacteroidota bacterium]
MKNLGVVITDGVGFRNFILNNFISNAVLAFEKVSGLKKCKNVDVIILDEIIC